jgi:hypothetical protein
MGRAATDYPDSRLGRVIRRRLPSRSTLRYVEKDDRARPSDSVGLFG